MDTSEPTAAPDTDESSPANTPVSAPSAESSRESSEPSTPLSAEPERIVGISAKASSFGFGETDATGQPVARDKTGLEALQSDTADEAESSTNEAAELPPPVRPVPGEQSNNQAVETSGREPSDAERAADSETVSRPATIAPEPGLPASERLAVTPEAPSPSIPSLVGFEAMREPIANQGGEAEESLAAILAGPEAAEPTAEAQSDNTEPAAFYFGDALPFPQLETDIAREEQQPETHMAAFASEITALQPEDIPPLEDLIMRTAPEAEDGQPVNTEPDAIEAEADRATLPPITLDNLLQTQTAAATAEATPDTETDSSINASDTTEAEVTTAEPAVQAIAAISERIHQLDETEAAIAAIQLETVLELAGQLPLDSADKPDPVLQAKLEAACAELFEQVNIVHDKEALNAFLALVADTPPNVNLLAEAEKQSVPAQPLQDNFREVSGGNPFGSISDLRASLKHLIFHQLRLGRMALRAQSGTRTTSVPAAT